MERWMEGRWKVGWMMDREINGGNDGGQIERYGWKIDEEMDEGWIESWMDGGWKEMEKWIVGGWSDGEMDGGSTKR